MTNSNSQVEKVHAELLRILSGTSAYNGEVPSRVEAAKVLLASLQHEANVTGNR